MKRTILSVLFMLFTLLSLPPYAFCQEVTGIEIVEFGIYNRDVEKIIPDASTLIGSRNVVKNPKLIEQTNKIVAKLGTSFGFRYKILGKSNGDTVTLEKELVFPETTNPVTGKTSSRSVTKLSRKIGSTYFTDFSFEEPWELAPGQYKISLFYNGRKLSEKIFFIESNN